MTFVSKNPDNVNSNNPHVGADSISIVADKLAPGTEIVGYFKHKFVDDKYKKENYVLKCVETGRDILVYSCTSLIREMAFYDQGQLLKLIYKGKFENKGGIYRGKLAHIWEVLVDSSFVPSHEFIASLAMEVNARKQQIAQVQNSSGFGVQMQNQAATPAQANNFTSASNFNSKPNPFA